MVKYGVNVIDEMTGEGYLLLKESSEDYELFNTFEDAERFNLEFMLLLEEMMASEVVEVNM